MLSNPKQGQRVQLHYATKPKGAGMAEPSEFMPHHGKLGTITVVGRGKPRNHGVRLDDGEFVGVPAGNLRAV